MSGNTVASMSAASAFCHQGRHSCLRTLKETPQPMSSTAGSVGNFRKVMVSGSGGNSNFNHVPPNGAVSRLAKMIRSSTS